MWSLSGRTHLVLQCYAWWLFAFIGVPVWHYPAVANVTASTVTINLPRRHHKAHHDHKMRLEHRWRQLPATQWQPWRTVEVIPADTTQYTLNQLITGVQPGAEHELRLGKMRKDETVSKYSLVAMISTPTRGECPAQKLVLASCYKGKKRTYALKFRLVHTMVQFLMIVEQREGRQWWVFLIVVFTQIAILQFDVPNSWNSYHMAYCPFCHFRKMR